MQVLLDAGAYVNAVDEFSTVKKESDKKQISQFDGIVFYFETVLIKYFRNSFFFSFISTTEPF